MDVAPIVTAINSTSGQSSAKATRRSPINPELTAQEKQQVQKLQARDRSVRAHEAAHIAAGGALITSGARFDYQIGPDGKRYAVGGEVSIDTAKVNGDPDATIRKAQQIRSAALAPAQPSSQDRTVAAKASQMAVQARAEIRQQTPSSNTSVNAFTFSEPTTGSQFDFTV